LEKTKLFIRRTITLFLSTLLLLAGWAGIIALSLFEKDIQTNLKKAFVDDSESSNTKAEILGNVASFIPNIGQNVINAVVGFAIKLVTKFEAWDFKEQEVKQLVWR
jgi:hypothetical protein